MKRGVDHILRKLALPESVKTVRNPPDAKGIQQSHTLSKSVFGKWTGHRIVYLEKE
jgi:hypothetical protein